MEKIVHDRLGRLEFGEVQRFRNMSAVPLFASNGNGLFYLTLREALDSGTLVISEVSAGGSVPELKVINKGDVGVLLLDGEELMGAKQNRVLNTTILVKARSEMLVPVSCTEAGRWDYTSPRFDESGHMMAHKIRSDKHRSVSRNLDARRTFDSDQVQVWNNISKLAEEARVSSPTRAMRDVQESMDKQIDEYLPLDITTIDNQIEDIGRECDQIIRHLEIEMGNKALEIENLKYEDLNSWTDKGFIEDANKIYSSIEDFTAHAGLLQLALQVKFSTALVKTSLPVNKIVLKDRFLEIERSLEGMHSSVTSTKKDIKDITKLMDGGFFTSEEKEKAIKKEILDNFKKSSDERVFSPYEDFKQLINKMNSTLDMHIKDLDKPISMVVELDRNAKVKEIKKKLLHKNKNDHQNT